MAFTPLAYLDGQIAQEEEVKIPLKERGFLFGDGAYATIKVLEGIPLFLPRHLAKLKTSCELLKIAFPAQLKEEEILRFLTAHSSLPPLGRLRIFITGGENPLMRLPERAAGHLIMTLETHTLLPYAPLILKRFPQPFSLCHASFKSLAHLNRYFVMDYACTNGGDDGFTVSPEGFILEASFGNLLWFEGQNAFTPDPTLPLHPGITLSVMREILAELGYKLHEVRCKLEEIPSSAYIFRINTMSEIRPISELEERKFSRSLTLEEKLRSAFAERVEKERAVYFTPLSLS